MGEGEGEGSWRGDGVGRRGRVEGGEGRGRTQNSGDSFDLSLCCYEQNTHDTQIIAENTDGAKKNICTYVSIKCIFNLS